MFEIRLNGANVPHLDVRQNPERLDEWRVYFHIDDIGWFAVEEGDDLKYRDEKSWLLLPVEMRQASVDKGWCRATPRELIEVLELAGAIE